MQDAISPQAIREARESAGMTQGQAAKAAGLTRATIQNAESGRRSPAGYVLAALSRAYGVSMDTFVAHEQNAASAANGHEQHDDESPAHADAPAAVVSGVASAGRREGALTKE